MKPEETVDFHIRWSWHNISRMYNLKASDFGGTMAIGYTLLNIDKDVILTYFNLQKYMSPHFQKMTKVEATA